MSKKHLTEDFWCRAAAVEHVWPKHAGEWPDEDQPGILRELCVGRVCEVGCGTGRVAKVFDPNDYIGVDINPHAIAEARRVLPDGYVVNLIEWDDEYPWADTYLFHHVLLHVHEDELPGVLKRCHPSRVVIAKRNDKAVCFHRAASVYTDVLKELGYTNFQLLQLATNYKNSDHRHFLVATKEGANDV